MRVNQLNRIAGVLFLTATAGFWMSSCTKDTDGSPQIKPGNPVATALSPDSAAGGSLVTLTGTGLGDIRSIVFEKGNVPAGFQSTLNTEGALIFRVPADVLGGSQNIIFTNSAGNTLKVPFKALAYPTVASVSNYNFTKGTVITLTGNNFDDVTAVTLTDSVKGVSDVVTIVSKAKAQLVVQMPASSLNRAPLRITNGTGRMTTAQEFVNIDKAYPIFTDAYGPGFKDASWGDAAAVSTKEFASGAASVGKNFQKGNWHLIGFSTGSPLAYSTDYTYVTGWVKGASADYSLYLTTDASKAGFGEFVDKNKIDVKAGVWNYFRLKLSDIDFWAAGKSLSQIGFRIQGPNNQDETFYFDDLMLVK
ncbi:IPT/TIG domain-containing protein [Spirosoma koreense]